MHFVTRPSGRSKKYKTKKEWKAKSGSEPKHAFFVVLEKSYAETGIERKKERKREREREREREKESERKRKGERERERERESLGREEEMERHNESASETRRENMKIVWSKVSGEGPGRHSYEQQELTPLDDREGRKTTRRSWVF